jgi:adenylylsulfate reductase subunit A
MPKTIVEDNIDILVAGAGLGGTGAAFEARYWGKDKKIVIWEPVSVKITRKITFATRAST